MYRYIKRVIDLSITIPLFFILSPLIGVIGLLVRLKLGQPIIFRQERPGLQGRPMTLFKFRTMTDAMDMDGNLLSDAERLTSFGRFLRASSLDELPELINILRGEMSLVGPRPLIPEYLSRYSDENFRRHQVLPGLTGWAQINGRNAISWDEKFALDTWYVDHQSLWLDLKIMFLTFWKIFKRDDINQPGHATMPVFMGKEASASEPPSRDP